MVIMGCIIGVITFLIQGSVKWDGSSVGLSLVMLAMLSTMFMIPSAAGLPTEIRGHSEMFPVNGPYWSLFFEYIGNILYALFLRKISTKILGCIAVVSGVLLAYISISQGQLGIGWTLADYGFWGGLIRMLFPYSIGMYMARIFRPMQIKGAFWKCGLILVVIALLPIVSTEGIPWLTGAYDAFCVLFIFPALVWMGASELKIGKQTTDVCRFVGDLSYPLYTIHYPFMYLFYAHIGFNGESSVLTIKETWPEAIALVIGCLVLAWLCMKFYDLPVRRWLTKKYLYDK
jgi:peptidoglycan/LPS O-acetylase OafA/YrhL